MTGQLSLRAAGGSDTGLQRDQNEDRFLIDTLRGGFCVVDGVGGHPGGERAAAVAVEMIGARLARETGSPAERLREAITLANNAILDQAGKNPSLAGMTCVLTAAIVSGRRLTVGHVGDTRLYKLRAGAIRKLTRDHSPVGEREDAGEISEVDAMQHPRRNEVYRDVGTDPHTPEDDGFVEIVETTFEPDAALIVCSDGLSDQVPSASIRHIVEAHAGDPEEAVRQLLRAANDAGGKDNVTAIVVYGHEFGARAGRPVTAPAGWRGRAWAWFVAGLLIGLAAAAVIWRVQPGLWQRQQAVVPTPAPAAPPAARTWTVGLTGAADAPSIAEAMARAQPGDTVVLTPGDYREQIVVGQGVAIEGPRTAMVRPPLGAAADWTAVVVDGVTGARLTGFSIAAADGQPLATGIRVRQADVEIVDLEASGATEAALEVGDGGVASVLNCVIRDNAGTGIVARDGSRLRLRHSSILRNGTSAGRLRPGIQLGTRVEASLVGNAIGDNGGAAIDGWPEKEIATLVRHNLVRPAPRAVRPAPAADTPRRPRS